MKNSVKYILSICLVWMMVSGCSKDDPSGFSGNCGDDVAWFELVSDESNSVIDASSAYSADPTTANCQNLKAAYSEYIRALKEVSDCVLGPARTSYQQSLQSAEDEIDQVCQ